MEKIGLKETISKISEGVLETTIDLILWLAYYQADVLVNPQGRLVWPHAQAAEKKLAKINYQTLKSSLAWCRTKGLIAKPDKRKTFPQISAMGKKRLISALPFYDKERVWDKRLYLITYDIPEIKRFDRQILREYLKRLGCAMMQQSVWLTPYNPREILREFIKQRNLHGTIIVSDIGRDGSVGDEDIKSLIKRIYQLDKINKRYEHFIKRYQKTRPAYFAQANFAFLSIVKDDPQLPFELLPNDWRGDRAYRLYRLFRRNSLREWRR